MSNAISATGILLKRGDGATPEVFTTIAELTSVKAPGYSRNKIETSTHNDGSESYVLGILRRGDSPFRVNWLSDDATHAQILSDIEANTRQNWQVELPNGDIFEGPARVQKFDPIESGVDSALQMECALTWAGTITFTPAP